MLPPGFSSNEPIHITFDNSDGRQQTITGGQTTHQTTATIFQVKPGNNDNNIIIIIIIIIIQDIQKKWVY